MTLRRGMEYFVEFWQGEERNGSALLTTGVEITGHYFYFYFSLFIYLL